MRQIILDSTALKHNFLQVKVIASKSKILSMVKANAYGHGLIWVSEQLASVGTDALGVAVLEEAKALRTAGFQLPIFLMDGFLTAAELKEALTLKLNLVLFDWHHLQLLEETKLTQALEVWLKVDTGMHRLGFPPELVETVYSRLKMIHGIQTITLMTHFSDADHPKNVKTTEQIQLLETVKSKLIDTSKKDIPTSLANSAGILAWPKAHANWVRPGIMLYGASPFGSPDPTLKPVMTVQSNIISLHHFPTGAQIGYESSYICQKPMRIAVLAFGYGDGYPRAALFSQVYVKGKLCSVIGRVSMDMLQIDVTDHPEIQIGDLATLWGQNCPIENLAKASGTISYEIFCHVQQQRLHTIKV